MRPYILSETNWKNIKDSSFEVAILPWGATEAHNYHLPYGSDHFQSEYVAAESAKKAWDTGAKVIVLPGIPYGVNTGQFGVKLCMNMNPKTQFAILKDIAYVLLKHNIQKMVIINSHGGNHFKNMIREMSVELPELFLCSIDWWKIVNSKEYFKEPGDHAGEMESSVMMHINADLTLPLEEAGSGQERKFRIKGLKEGWVSAQREWTKVSEDTGVGDPSEANAEKGEAFLKMVTNEIGEFLNELAISNLDDLYES